MRVKSIVLDGFKSYAHRQELSDLDHHFNAITGLNGSGKSNIFDAICFVMGISNLKKVRAEDQRDLIFKNGNAGIQKATVTIEFENSDPSPPEFPRSVYPTITIQRQILTNQTSKFLLNGRTVAVNDIRKFFQNIGLNVDNPHFMVLQGTVHKLIGMKSQEILGWLEEAAGTRVFDARRRAAEHMIASKERKVQELNRIIDEEIRPELARMSEEQDAYNKFVKQIEGLDQKRRFRVALQFYRARVEAEQAAERTAAAKEEIAVAQRALKTLPKEVEEATARVKELEAAANAPNADAERLQLADAEARRGLTKSTSQLAATEKTLKQQEKAVKKAEDDLARVVKQRDNDAKAGEAHRREHETRLAELETAEREVGELKEAIRLNRSGVQAGSSGLTIQQELEKISREVINAEGVITRNRQSLAELESEAVQLQKRVDGDSSLHKQTQQQLRGAQQRVADAQAAYAPFAEADRQVKSLGEQLQRVSMDHRKFLAEANAAGANPFSCEPIPGVDLDAVIKGRVGELLRVTKQEYTLALSIGATRNALDRVVVTEDGLVQRILDEGRPAMRTYFMALNKAQGGVLITPERLEEARRIARAHKGYVELALNLVEYDAAYAPVMERTFGGFFVCSTLEIAKELAFNPRVKCKAVTAEGDVADPSGTMSGGGNAHSAAQNDVLARYGAAALTKGPLERVTQQLQQLREQLHRASARVQEGAQRRRELDDAEMALQQLTDRLNNSQGATALQQLKENSTSRALLSERLVAKQAELAALLARQAELREQQTADPQVVVKALQAKLKAREANVAALREAVNAGRDRFDRLEDERAKLDQNHADMTEQLRERQREAAESRASIEQLRAEVAAAEARLAELDTERARLDERARKLREALQEAREAHAKLATDLELAQRGVKDGEHTLRTLARAADEAKKVMRDLDRGHEWIAAEQAHFGPADGPYYFDDEARTEQTLNELREAEISSEQMGRRVNKKATVLYDQCKREYDELVAKRATLDEDRALILSTITVVEARKWESLDKMVAKVSEGFSSLFRACLPGASCRLVEARDPETKRLTGLEVRVAFNGKEKDTLSELSGGQRSLLALCLILAILRIRKAPIYILDEVDAALDPSHTQNIGKMIQMHFPDAQFLLVSLKDGMFNNANVLFEIRNTQGYSEISRKESKKKT